MKNRVQISTMKPSIIFLVFAIGVGGYIRFEKVLDSSIPLNDGGLFYTMTQDLINNGFRLPEFTSYNHLNIPFAYPPFAFYLSGLLHVGTGWTLLDIFRIMPAFFSVLTIFAFFIFAKKLIKPDFQVGIATVIFAFIPAAFDWMIMGGGITRSLGFLFSLLSMNSAFQLFNSKQRIKPLIYTTLFATLTALTHPEATIHTVMVVLTLFFFFEMNRDGIIKSIVVVFVTIIFTSPWWLSVLSFHGFEPILSALKAGLVDTHGISRIIIFNFTNEPAIQISAVLGLLGLFLLISRKEYILPVMFIVVFVSAPRSSWRYLTIVIAMMASYALVHFFNATEQKDVSCSRVNSRLPLSSIWSKILFAQLILIWVFSSYYTVQVLRSTKSLTEEDIEAFNWITSNTLDNSKFLVIAGQDPLFDPSSEWFPALTGRQSVSTVYGQEWLAKKQFSEVVANSTNAQNCFNNNVECVAQWLIENQQSIDFIYLNQKNYLNQNNELEPIDSLLRLSIAQSQNYRLVYNNEFVFVFQRIN